MDKLILKIVCLLMATLPVLAQKNATSFHHVEPPFWWIGMKNSSVQILFHNKEINLHEYKPAVNYKGIAITEVKQTENTHYLFVTIEIAATAKPGEVPFKFSSHNNTFSYSYTLKQKVTSATRIQGFNSSDVVYLIMPDRFSNGDQKNDSLPDMFEGAHRDKPEARHGGDIRGISNHLDYIKELGVTAIWLNPVLENNQKKSSYHGYAITDLYNVDRRFGGNGAYRDFIDRSHDMGLKVIQDMVMNHIGNDHWFMHDLPEKNWVHHFPAFTRSNYQGNVISDPYQSQYDAVKMGNGWFDTTMPDVNQSNPLFARYLIQNTLWWIEHWGIDGIRMDTHPYPDKDFMAAWAKAVMDEYPKFNIVGEVWINSIPITAYWQKGMVNKDGYQSNLPTVTDFPFCFTVPQALNEAGSWDTGMRRLYTLLSQDFIYPDPNHNLTFLDNHDMTRFFLSVGKDLNKFKMGLAFLLTTRGIPQLYYGTELLMDGDGAYHPNVRKDFPGGWPGDQTNAFMKEGRTKEQNEAFNYLKTLLNWRKDQKAVHQGRLIHFIPEDNIYVYFRIKDRNKVMVILNANAEERVLSTQIFSECLQGIISGRDVITNEALPIKNIIMPALSARILELH